MFQRLVLGPDAHLVVGLPKLLVQVSPGRCCRHCLPQLSVLPCSCWCRHCLPGPPHAMVPAIERAAAAAKRQHQSWLHASDSCPSYAPQSAELAAWNATTGWQLMPTCMDRVSAAAQQLQTLLAGAAAEGASAAAAAAAAGAAQGAASSAGAHTASPGVRDSMHGVLGELSRHVATVQQHSGLLSAADAAAAAPAGAGARRAKAGPANSTAGQLGLLLEPEASVVARREQRQAARSSSGAAAGSSDAGVLGLASPKELGPPDGMRQEGQESVAAGSDSEGSEDGGLGSHGLPSPGPWGHAFVVISAERQAGGAAAAGQVPGAPLAASAPTAAAAALDGSPVIAALVEELVEEVVAEVERGEAGGPSASAAAAVQGQAERGGVGGRICPCSHTPGAPAVFTATFLCTKRAAQSVHVAAFIWTPISPARPPTMSPPRHAGPAPLQLPRQRHRS